MNTVEREESHYLLCSPSCNMRTHPIKSGSYYPSQTCSSYPQSPERQRRGEQRRRGGQPLITNATMTFAALTPHLLSWAEICQLKILENIWTGSRSVGLLTAYSKTNKLQCVCVSACSFSAVKVTHWSGRMSQLSACSSDPRLMTSLCHRGWHSNLIYHNCSVVTK